MGLGAGREFGVRRLIAFSIDLFLVAAATSLAFAIRENFEFTPDKVAALAPHFGFTVLAAAIVIPLLGLHRSVWRFTSMADYLYVVAAAVLIVLAAVVASFTFNRLDGVARSIPLLQAILILVVLVGARVFMRLRHAHRRKPQAQFSAVAPAALSPPSVLIVGLNRLTELYLQAAHELNPGQVHVAGLIGHGDRHTGRLMHRYAVLGTPEQIPDVVKNLEVQGVAVDRILITAPWSSLSGEAQAALRDLETTSSVRLLLLSQSLGLGGPDALMAQTADVPPREDDGLRVPETSPALHVTAEERVALKANPYWSVKRILDIIAALSLILLLAPLMAIVTLLALIDVGRPVFFWQQRPGLGGRPFRLYKLRTMRAAHDESGRRLSDAERLSPIGRFLRATRMDELPQLFHILAGQMSFVGPRPLLPVDQPIGFAARLLVRPGLTGWAQIKGGRSLSASDKAALDVWYVRNASFLLDTKILFGTVLILLFGERADGDAIRKAWSTGL
jgi:lipopolysaccharide/colanic/teichoic acid biosynthesis glycosyltransferase